MRRQKLKIPKKPNDMHYLAQGHWVEKSMDTDFDDNDDKEAVDKLISLSEQPGSHLQPVDHNLDYYFPEIMKNLKPHPAINDIAGIDILTLDSLLKKNITPENIVTIIKNIAIKDWKQQDIFDVWMDTAETGEKYIFFGYIKSYNNRNRPPLAQYLLSKQAEHRDDQYRQLDNIKQAEEEKAIAEEEKKIAEEKKNTDERSKEPIGNELPIVEESHEPENKNSNNDDVEVSNLQVMAMDLEADILPMPELPEPELLIKQVDQMISGEGNTELLLPLNKEEQPVEPPLSPRSRLNERIFSVLNQYLQENQEEVSESEEEDNKEDDLEINTESASSIQSPIGHSDKTTPTDDSTMLLAEKEDDKVRLVEIISWTYYKTYINKQLKQDPQHNDVAHLDLCTFKPPIPMSPELNERAIAKEIRRFVGSEKHNPISTTVKVMKHSMIIEFKCQEPEKLGQQSLTKYLLTWKAAQDRRDDRYKVKYEMIKLFKKGYFLKNDPDTLYLPLINFTLRKDVTINNIITAITQQYRQHHGDNATVNYDKKSQRIIVSAPKDKLQEFLKAKKFRRADQPERQGVEKSHLKGHSLFKPPLLSRKKRKYTTDDVEMSSPTNKRNKQR